MANSRKTSRDRIKASTTTDIPKPNNGGFSKSFERKAIKENFFKEPRYSGNTKSWYI